MSLKENNGGSNASFDVSRKGSEEKGDVTLSEMVQHSSSLFRLSAYRGWLCAAVIVAIVIIDQWIKIWIKTHFYLGEELVIFPWFRLLFIENNGMAFGMEFGSKLLLTIFRIVVVGLLIWYIVRIYRFRSVPTGYLVCLALITAGAAGNIFDCVFYGEIFNNPAPPAVATLFPPGGGYAPWFMGRVVDMFYFPLFSFVWPSWLPGIGGQEFLFFQPIFNFADASISVGVIVLLIFYNKCILSPSQFAKEAKIDSTNS